MPEPTTPAEIGAFIEQSKQNAESIKGLRSEFTEGFNELRKAVDRMGERIHIATRPNFSTMAALCAVILTVIAMVAAPIGFFFWNAVVQLDVKLQKEFALSIETATQAVKNLNDISKERHDHAVSQSVNVQQNVDRLWERIEGQNRADMEELRQRRMRDSQK